MTNVLTKHRVVAILSTLVLCAAVCAAPILDASHIKETTLDNGLHVVVKEEPHWGIVAVGFCIKASPLYEGEGQSGLADLVRHMIFDVRRGDAPALAEELADIGATFDSYTSLDATQVRMVVSTRALPELFAKLATGIFEAEFDEAVWARQRQELRRRLMDAQKTPEGTLWRLLWETAFRQHPYGKPVAGSADGIAMVDAKSLAAFHEAFYTPGNISLIVVGDVEAQAVFDLAARCVGKYPARPLEPTPVSPEPPQTESRTRLRTVATRATWISHAWPASGMDNTPDVCTLDIIYAILGEGPDARLFKALMDQEEVQAVPEVEFITKRDPGLFVITCVAKREAEFDTREAVVAEVEKLRTEKVTDEELARAKELIRIAYTFDNATYTGQVGSMAFYEAIDSYRFAVDYMPIINRVTVEDVQRVAMEYLDPTKCTLVIVRPKVRGNSAREARLIP